jgi:hypothetical protein
MKIALFYAKAYERPSLEAANAGLGMPSPKSRRR